MEISVGHQPKRKKNDTTRKVFTENYCLLIKFEINRNRIFLFNLQQKIIFSLFCILAYLGIYIHVYVVSCFSPVSFFATQWTITCQAPLSVEFSRQEYWSRLLFPPPGDLPGPRIEPVSLTYIPVSLHPALADRFFTTSTTQEALSIYVTHLLRERSRQMYPFSSMKEVKRLKCIQGQDFLCCSVIGTPCFHFRAHGFDPCLGNQDPAYPTAPRRTKQNKNYLSLYLSTTIIHTYVVTDYLL